MPLSLIFFIILHLSIFAYMVELLRRLAYRNREYPLDESKETLPFGFFRLRHMVLLLILSYVVWVIFSLWLYEYFINSL